MNKKLVGYLSQNGFTYDNNCFCGNLKGYQVSGVCVGNTINLTFYLNVSDADSQQIYDWFNNAKRAYGITAISIDQISVNCTINAFLNPAQKCIELIINGVDFLATLKAPNCCPFCGLPLEGNSHVEAENAISENEDKGAARLVGIGSNRLYAHEKCFDEYASAIANQEVVAANAPGNYLKGTLGALIGCLAGCLLWGLLYYIGYLAIVAAIVISLGAAFLWDKLGGKNDKIKLVVIWVVSLIMMTITMFISYAIDVQVAIAELETEGYDIEGSAFEWFFNLLELDDEYRTAIIMDTVISYIFIIAGNIFTTLQILKTQKLTSNTLIKL